MVEDIVMGKEGSAARLISQIESGRKEAYEALSLLLPYSGKAYVIGITGPAGAGKSTLTGRLAVSFADRGRKVAVIATDPTSIDGRGAFLGDRLRMKEAEERHVFIRSMAHRGYPGGVARATMGAVYILEGLGKDLIILESVGAGQSEKELSYLCDTVITLFTPDYGDEIQLMKAGLMEIGDIVVLNKADTTGADEALRQLEVYTSLITRAGGWRIPVVSVQAHQGKGLDSLADAIEAHWESLDCDGRRREKKREKTGSFLLSLLKQELWKGFSEALNGSAAFENVVESVQAGTVDPYSAINRLLEEMRITGKDWQDRLTNEIG